MKFKCFSIVSITLILTLVGCNRQPETPVTSSSSAVNTVVAVTAVLVTIPDDEKPVPTIPGHGGDSELPDQPASFQVIFSESGNGVAYLAEKDGNVYVVHNGIRNKKYSEIGTVVISPDGLHVAYAANEDGKWLMVIDGKEGRPYDTLMTPIFSPDNIHVAYQAKEREKWYVVVDDRRNEGTIASYPLLEFNADSTMIAYLESASSKDRKLFVSDLMFNERYVRKSIGDLMFTVNKERTRIVAEQVVGDKLRIIDFDFGGPYDVHEGPLYDLIEQLAISDDGESITYCALHGKKRLIIFDTKEEPFPPGQLRELPVIRPDKKGVGVLLMSKDHFRLHQAFTNSKEKDKTYDMAESLTFSKDGGYAFAARTGANWFIVVNGKEGPGFDRVVTPVFSPDGKLVIYRARNEGQRFVVVADTTGKTIRQHPAYEQVFQPVFTDDGKSVAYGVKDGNKLIWEVEKL